MSFAQRYSDKTKGWLCAMRNLDLLKSKFDKRIAVKNPTGDPSCSPEVRRAKHVSCDLLDRASSGTVMSSEDELETDSDEDEGSLNSSTSPSQYNMKINAQTSARHCLASQPVLTSYVTGTSTNQSWDFPTTSIPATTPNINLHNQVNSHQQSIFKAVSSSISFASSGNLSVCLSGNKCRVT